MSDLIKDAVNYLGGMLYKNNKDLLNFLRVPTPVKVTYNLVADANGNIGGGFANPNPVLIYQCPMSHEGWVHRLAVTSPSGQPKSPLTTGQLILISGAGDPLMFFPVGGAIAPVLVTEGRGSAFHLNSGSFIRAYGDTFAAGTALRIDMQIILVQGMSEYTPREHFSEKVTVLE